MNIKDIAALIEIRNHMYTTRNMSALYSGPDYKAINSKIVEIDNYLKTIILGLDLNGLETDPYVKEFADTKLDKYIKGFVDTKIDVGVVEEVFQEALDDDLPIDEVEDLDAHMILIQNTMAKKEAEAKKELEMNKKKSSKKTKKIAKP